MGFYFLFCILYRLYANTGRRPKGDPESRLGVMIHFPKPFQKKIRYFWGYRNFVLCDAWSELPIIEETRPANMVDSQVIIPQLRKVSDKFGFQIGAIIAECTH